MLSQQAIQNACYISSAIWWWFSFQNNEKKSKSDLDFLDHFRSLEGNKPILQLTFMTDLEVEFYSWTNMVIHTLCNLVIMS